MKKTQILLWETTGLGQGLGLGLYLFYFILNSSPVTHDGVRKNMMGIEKYGEEISDE